MTSVGCGCGRSGNGGQFCFVVAVTNGIGELGSWDCAASSQCWDVQAHVG